MTRNLVSCLLTLLLLTPAAFAATSEEAAALLRSGDADSALALYMEVLESEPDNRAALTAVVGIAMDMGIGEIALEFSRRLSTLAAESGDFATAAASNADISMIQAQLPDWAESKLEAASAYSEADAPAIEMLQTLSRDAQVAMQQGDMEAAVASQESALLVAEESLGPDHWVTGAAARDLGYVYRNAGMAEPAEQYYSQALGIAELALGESHPETLQIVGLLAELYGAVGDSQQSVGLWELAATGYATALGAEHRYAIEASANLVSALEAAGEFEAAVTTGLDLCGDIERGYGEYHPEAINCLSRLGGLQATTGALSDAENNYATALTRLGKIQSGVDATVLGTLAQLAEIKRQQGRYQEAKDLLSGTIQLALQSGNREASYTAKAYLGRVFNNLGEFDQALQLTNEVLDYGLATWQDNPLNIYNTLLELGAIYQALGRLAEAEATFEEAFAGLMETYGAMHPSTLVATNNLGQIKESIGLYDEAEPILEMALANLEAALGPAHPDTLRARNNLALLHESQGNFREAEPLYQASLDLMLEVHGENYTDTVAVRNNLAFLYMLMQDYEPAAAMFEQVVVDWTTLLGPDHQNTLKARNNLARAYRRLDRFTEANDIFVETLAARQAVLGPLHVDSIRSMIDLGDLMLAQGRLAEAEELVTRALTTAETTLSEQHPYTFDALNLLIRVKRASGELESAASLADEGMRRRSKFLDRMLWTTGENAREGYIRLHKPEFDTYMSLLAEAGDAESGKRVIDASLQRKGLLLKVTSEIQQIATLSRDPTLRALADELQQSRKQLAALTLSGPTAETQGRHTEMLYDLEQQVNRLQGELGRASVRFRTSISQVSADTLETVLRDNTALVDFVTYDEGDDRKILAGVMRKQDGDVSYELVRYEDRAAVEASIVDYRTFIQDDLADEDDILETGQIAYEQVWQPLSDALSDLEYIYVVPDGLLNIVPFNALVDEDETYLIQKQDLHILSSGRDLLPSQFKLAKGEYIIMAGPDYDSADIVPAEQIAAAEGRRSSALQLGLRSAGTGLRGLNFAPLPGAEEEGRIITRQVEQKNAPNVVYFGEDAQEQVLSALTEPPEILHMATHGFFLEADENLRKRLLKLQRSADLHVPPPGDNPLLRAGLAFAGINNNARFLGDIDTENDGVLTALEVLDLDLSGTQLVVLSACETGLGEIHEGEGVYGLRRSFQEAGVAEVISSLWEVSDAGTQALMTSFYDRLLAGTPARVALREAQLELMESPRWGYPYVWSAFMIVGSYESAGFAVQ
ncbi:MAG: CHAT domain-containing protein [Pseudomonadota bacterium]